MKLWSKFVESLTVPNALQFTSRLHEKTSELFPDKDETFITQAACLSGLMARVAYADLNIDGDEKEVIASSLTKWFGFNNDESRKLADLCTAEIKDLAGIENHLYCLPLRESLSIDDRFKILETLFAIAAADKNVENQESEEIRNISNALLLEHHHFIGARTKVLEFLGSLKA